MPTQMPADDADLKAAQLEKLRAETDKLRAERSKLEREADVVPRMATGSFWSEAIKILGAIVLGIGGVVTAAGAFFTARNQVEMAELKATEAKRISTNAEAATAEAEAAKKSALEARDVALREKEGAEKSVGELRVVLAQLTAKVQAANPKLVARRLVYIQFQGSVSRAVINDLRTSLETQGYTAPGAERVAGDYRSVVRYFRPADKAVAEALGEQTEAFFSSRGCSIQLRVLQAEATGAEPPLEVWLAHPCR